MDPKLISGTVEMMILQVLIAEPTYGYKITQEVLERSKGAFQLKEGSLYPALHRMEGDGMLTSYWVETESGRRRKYYRITAAGKEALAAKVADWKGFSASVNAVLGGSTYALA